MDKSTESKISGPLLHWTKVMILNSTKVSLENSSRVANTNLSVAYASNKDIYTWETLLRINSMSLTKVSELIEKATEFIPEGMREWPSQN